MEGAPLAQLLPKSIDQREIKKEQQPNLGRISCKLPTQEKHVSLNVVTRRFSLRSRLGLIDQELVATRCEVRLVHVLWPMLKGEATYPINSCYLERYLQHYSEWHFLLQPG